MPAAVQSIRHLLRIKPTDFYIYSPIDRMRASCSVHGMTWASLAANDLYLFSQTGTDIQSMGDLLISNNGNFTARHIILH